MSAIKLFPASRRSTPFRRRAWGEMFGDLLRNVRLGEGRSVEEAAAAAGMEPAEWEAVEAGQVPETWEQAWRMADAISTDRSWMATLVVFCSEAWSN